MLLTTCDPTLVLMNPGKVSFMNLYAYRSNTEKTESRVGRAVWCAMHALNEGSKNMKDRQAGATDARKNGAVGSDEQDAEADIDQGEEQDEDNEDEDDVDSELDSDDFGAQEITLNFSQLARGGNNVIVVGDGQSQPVVTSRDQVSFATNGSITVGRPSHSGASRVALKYPRTESRSSRSKFKAP
jgi:hypothetical protein